MKVMQEKGKYLIQITICLSQSFDKQWLPLLAVQRKNLPILTANGARK